MAGVAATFMLGGCGGGKNGGSEGVVQITTPISTAPAPAPAAAAALSADELQLNVALTLAYLGAQYHGLAANGAGLPGDLLTGAGRLGAVTGGRQVTLPSESDAALAKMLASDKLRHVSMLRSKLASSTMAQPAIDFSAAYDSAFSAVGRAAGIAGPSGSFDPFVDVNNYILGGIILERQVAAIYRNVALSTLAPGSGETVSALLPDAIYHDALLRTMLEEKAETNPALRSAAAGIDAYLSKFDETGNASIPDIAATYNQPIVFVRSGGQVMQTLVLGAASSAPGGFLPSGANITLG